MRGTRTHHPTTTAVALATLTMMTALALAPPAVAFHGSPYQADGTATSRTTGLIFDARVTFSGQSYAVEMWERQTGEGLRVHRLAFPAEETYANITILLAGEHDEAWCPGPLVVGDIHGRDIATVLVHSDDLPPIFEIEGPLKDCLANGHSLRELTGTYLDFDLDVRLCTFCPADP